MNYKVKSLIFSSGERTAILLDKDGLPLFWTTIWVTSLLRGRNLSFNTIESALRCIKILYQYLDLISLDLEERLFLGNFLSLSELEGMIRFMRFHSGFLEIEQRESLLVVPKKILMLEKNRKNLRSNDKVQEGEIASDSLRKRLIYTSGYLLFLIQEKIYRTENDHKTKASLLDAKNLVESFFAQRTPKKRDSLSFKRQGLSKEEQTFLFSAIDPSSDRNPWKSENVRLRNALIVYWLMETGIRRGEILNLLILDIDFQGNCAKIVRRPDNKLDKRISPPLVKTHGREIHLSKKLINMTRDYILSVRKNNPNALRHGFLFTASDTGEPLSMKALNNIFLDIKNTFPNMFFELSPHVLRHTWNDRFSELMDEKGISPEREEKIRTELMGWSRQSKMASTYTRRHIKEKAKDILNKHQAKIFWNSNEKT